MASLNLIPVEFKHPEWTDVIKNLLAEATGLQVGISEMEMNFSDFYSSERAQYNASDILKRIEKYQLDAHSLILTSEDIFIPIFTYVFGLAKLDGRAAIVSAHRLHNDFYGLPHNNNLLLERLEKEVNHETGHMFGLRHCHDYNCVMNSSVTIDDLDVKPKVFCSQCQRAFA